MSVPRNANDQLSAPHCRYCGFEMTPMQFGPGPVSHGLDRVYECRACGVMKLPEPLAPSVDPRGSAR